MILLLSCFGTGQGLSGHAAAKGGWTPGFRQRTGAVLEEKIPDVGGITQTWGGERLLSLEVQLSHQDAGAPEPRSRAPPASASERSLPSLQVLSDARLFPHLSSYWKLFGFGYNELHVRAYDVPKARA